jgi:hypothetical protein
MATNDPVSARDYPAPQFGGGEWSLLSAVLGVEIDDESRSRIAAAADGYVRDRYFEAQNDQRQGMRRSAIRRGSSAQSPDIAKLLAAINKAVSVWSAADESSRAAILDYDLAVGRNLDGLLASLNCHRVLLPQFLRESLNEKPFTVFVCRLAKIYERLLGMLPTVSIPKDAGDDGFQQSPFVKLVQTLDSLVAPSARADVTNTVSAWPAAVRRAMRKNSAGE